MQRGRESRGGGRQGGGPRRSIRHTAREREAPGQQRCAHPRFANTRVWGGCGGVGEARPWVGAAAEARGLGRGRGRGGCAKALARAKRQASAARGWRWCSLKSTRRAAPDCQRLVVSLSAVLVTVVVRTRAPPRGPRHAHGCSSVPSATDARVPGTGQPPAESLCTGHRLGVRAIGGRCAGAFVPLGLAQAQILAPTARRVLAWARLTLLF